VGAVLVVLLIAGLVIGLRLTVDGGGSASANAAAPSTAPPAADGYFGTRPAGSWQGLPTGDQCREQVHPSTWEPRPENAAANHTVPDAGQVHQAFATRPRTDSYDPRWNTWLLPRVDGQFTGTTDEIIQWAACKWGISDNLLRAQAIVESTWYQDLRFSDGQCYWLRGCGDAFPSPTADSKVYCDGVAEFGHDYQRDRNSAATSGGYPWSPQSGLCPQTFSIIGVKSWDDPRWQAPHPAWPGNQNGTFPFSRDSTAFALDYEGAYLRGCMEGFAKWLPANGDVWNCVGSWYSGDVGSANAKQYVSQVKAQLAQRTWLTADFAWGKGHQYHCDPVKGCPQEAP
jgi:hypothetical protein